MNSDAIEDDEIEFTNKAIEFETVTHRMGEQSTKLYIVDELNNVRVLVGMYSSRDRAEEIAYAIRWYSGSVPEIMDGEFGPPYNPQRG